MIAWAKRSAMRASAATALACLLSGSGVAIALDCPAMPQQSQRDTDIAVALAVGRIGQASGPQLQAQTRTVTIDLLKRLPRADRVYLEQMMYATYCSSLRDNAALTEAERNRRIESYNRELRATLYPINPPAAPRVDPRDAARADLARLPVEYTPAAFIRSAAEGKTAVVRLFLQAGMDPNTADSRGENALMHAAGRGDLPMLEMLMKAGAQVNRESRSGSTPLRWAARSGRLDAMRLLLKAGASRQSFDAAFQAALRGGHADAMRLMLEHGANARADDADTAYILTQVGRYDPQRVGEVLTILLQRGWPVDTRLRDGSTALMLSASDGSITLMELLLKAGADVNLHCDCSNLYRGGHSALTLASGRGHEHAVRLLIEAGAAVDAPSKDGTPLMMAIAPARPVGLVELLLSKGADPNKAVDGDGETALMVAAFRRPDLVPLLLAAGADVNARGKGGATALMRAAEADSTATARMLLDAGAEIDRRTERGRTALIIAAMAGSVDTARLLVQRGAKVDLLDEDNRSAVAHASDRLKGEERARMLALLAQKGGK